MWTHASHLQDVLQLSLSRPLVVFQSFNGSSHLYYDWSNIGSVCRALHHPARHFMDDNVAGAVQFSSTTHVCDW
jgi:hypothetical protein